MRTIFVLHVSILVGLFSSMTNAQDGLIEEVVVTGSFIGNDYYGLPAVTYRTQADFLVQSIRIVNDSRSPDVRREEIIETINNLIRASTINQEIELSYGVGFLAPINLNDDSLQIIDDRERIDNSYVNAYVKILLGDSSSTTEQIRKLRDFIISAELVGRSEVLVVGDIGLSVISPEQYRYDILRLISEENQNIKNAIGSTCETTISGLENRIEWERSGVDELTLYIPYSTEMSCN